MFDTIDWFDFIVGGIIIGFIINVASNIASPRIEKWWGKYNENKRNKNLEKRRIFDEKVELLSRNPHEEIVMRLEVNRLATYSIYTALFAIVIFLFPYLISGDRLLTLLFGVLPSALSLSLSIKAFTKRRDLAEILNSLDKKLNRTYLE